MEKFLSFSLASTGSATEVENYFIVYSFVLFFETQRLFIIPMFLRKQSWRNSFAMKLCRNCIFSITKFSEMCWKRWRFWGLWGTLEIVKTWSWNILLFEEILHYAALHSEWHGSVFYSRLGFWIIFETQRF